MRQTNISSIARAIKELSARQRTRLSKDSGVSEMRLYRIMMGITRSLSEDEYNLLNAQLSHLLTLRAEGITSAKEGLTK